MVFAILATLCAGLFAGAAIYINVAEHPARLNCGARIAVREFAPSYRSAARMQRSLAMIGLLAAVLGWWRMGHIALLVGGVLLGAAAFATLLVWVALA